VREPGPRRSSVRLARVFFLEVNVASFGDAAKNRNDEQPDSGFEILGGTLLVEVAVDQSRLEVLYEQIRDAARRGVLDGYADAAEEIARFEQAQGATDGARP
jgi:hypothetical protein